MPASSRKRNKGKDRKAKKAAKEEESKRIQIYNEWQDLAKGNLMSSGGMELNIPCNHGLGALLSEESHPVSRFISDYFSTDENLKIIFQRHPEVQNDDNHRKMAADILVRIETNSLIEDDNTGVNIAKAILILENYGKTGDYSNTIASRSVASKIRNQLCGTINSRRDLLKFYRKRTNCSCLKKKHLEARKTLPKLGSCRYCNVVKERRLLMVCSRCMVTQFCSRKCQVAASSRHREDCYKFAWAHHQQKMANDSS